MTPERSQNRYRVAKLILDLLHAVHGGLRADGEPVKIVDVDRVLITAVVLIGEHEGRPRTAANIVKQLGMSRETVRRKLATLGQIGVIERHGRHYCISKTPRPSDAFVDDAMEVMKGWKRSAQNGQLHFANLHGCGRGPIMNELIKPQWSGEESVSNVAFE